MTSNFFQTLVKIEQRGKKQQRLGKMADQSLKELDAEQTCQEILVPPFSKNTNINNPGTHSHLFLSLSRFVNYSTRYITAHSRSCPLCFLTAASIYYSVHFCNLWHYIKTHFFYKWPKNMNTGSNFTCTPGLFIFPKNSLLFFGRVR